MNNKLNIIFVLALSVVVVIGVYLWQESRIVSLLDDNRGISFESEALKEAIEELEDQLDTLEEQEFSSNETNNKEIATDDFKFDEENYVYYGKVIVNGYISLQETQEAFCEENCLTYTYVLFNVLNTDSEILDDYIGGQKGNAFVGDMSIGLGCAEDNILWRMNDSDEFGMKKYVSSAETSNAILNSSAENPVAVELERYLYTSGSGAPSCYSHFAQVDIAE